MVEMPSLTANDLFLFLLAFCFFLVLIIVIFVLFLFSCISYTLEAIYI